MEGLIVGFHSEPIYIFFISNKMSVVLCRDVKILDWEPVKFANGNELILTFNPDEEKSNWDAQRPTANVLHIYQDSQTETPNNEEEDVSKQSTCKENIQSQFEN